METETQIAKRQALKEIGLLRGDQKAAIAWLQKDYRGKVHTESGTVIGIGLFNSYYGRSKVIDEWLGILVNFPQLKRLDLTNARITDKGLKQLASLGNLQELTLYGTKVTDPAIGELAPLKSLRSLNGRLHEATGAASVITGVESYFRSYHGCRTQGTFNAPDSSQCPRRRRQYYGRRIEAPRTPQFAGKPYSLEDERD